jgi:hypothetical protein
MGFACSLGRAAACGVHAGDADTAACAAERGCTANAGQAGGTRRSVNITRW